MYQVLWRIPIPGVAHGIPIYGYGAMLFCAFVVCTYLAEQRAKRDGVNPLILQDLAVWLFVGGLLGARAVFMIQYGVPWYQFYEVWKGGLVFYGSAVGGLLAFLIYYVRWLRPNNVSPWAICDIVAPSLAVGLCLGRVGCLLNGCCYGNVACPDCAASHFPLCAPPRYSLVRDGFQSAAGFSMAEPWTTETALTVGAVEPGSPAEAAGLRPGDKLIAADDRPLDGYAALVEYLTSDDDRGWPRGKTDLTLTVRRGDQIIELPAFSPKTIGLHPTQLYESISMILLFFVLTSFYPLRRRVGQVMVLLMIGYAVHRYLNESIRNDTDPVLLGLTLSQVISLIVIAAAVPMGLVLQKYGQIPPEEPPPVPPEKTRAPKQVSPEPPDQPARTGDRQETPTPPSPVAERQPRPAAEVASPPAESVPPVGAAPASAPAPPAEPENPDPATPDVKPPDVPAIETAA